MQKKNDNFLEKLVKKNYNNELEKVLEKKYFDENAKNLLLSILYKIETAYKDYEKVKQNVETKEEFIQRIIKIIEQECDEIKIVKLHSEESEMLGKKTFLVEKNKKRIICYPIERKLLYCIAKIDKNEKIVKDTYFLLNKTISNLINVGNNIDTVEPMRDFNGYSWTTLSREIESVEYNIVYQNLRILVGYDFLNSWIKNNEFIIDYMESLKNRLEEKYGEKNKEEFIEILNKISILLAIKYDSKIKEQMKKEKDQIDIKLEKVKDNKKFVQQITREKRKLTETIKRIDETINNKEILQEEYEKRNENLPLQEKIFSIRILSQMMAKEREDTIQKLEELNKVLNPQTFVKYKKELQDKDKYLVLIEVNDIEETIKEEIRKLQEIFLKCYEKRIKQVQTKQELLKYIYEYRYYCLLPFDNEKEIYKVNKLEEQLKTVGKSIIRKAHELKVIDYFSKNEEIEYEILKNIFYARVIDLEGLYLKLIKEKDKYCIQIFDEDVFEEKIEIKNMGNINKKDMEIKFNKKIKIFN